MQTTSSIQVRPHGAALRQHEPVARGGAIKLAIAVMCVVAAGWANESHAQSTTPGTAAQSTSTEAKQSSTISLQSFLDVFGFQQQSSGTVQSDSSAARGIWLRIVPVIKAAEASREACLQRAAAAVHNQLNAIPASRDVDRYVQEALGLRSKGWAATNPSTHRQWLGDQFTKTVVPISDIVAAFRVHSQAFEQQLNAIDTDLLLKLKADIALDPSKIKCRSIQLTPVESAIRQTVSSVQSDVQTAAAQTVAIFFADWAAEETARHLARQSFAARNNGEVNMIQELSAWLIGVGTGVIVDKIAEEALDTDGKLERSVREHANRIVRSLQINGSSSRVWTDEFRRVQSSHDQSIRDALLEALPIDRTWALSQLNK